MYRTFFELVLCIWNLKKKLKLAECTSHAKSAIFDKGWKKESEGKRCQCRWIKITKASRQRNALFELVKLWQQATGKTIILNEKIFMYCMFIVTSHWMNIVVINSKIKGATLCHDFVLDVSYFIDIVLLKRNRRSDLIS